jgi:hypothetical protein
MKNFFKYLLFICLFGTQVFAQKQVTQTGDPNDLDERFVPDKNSTLNSSNDSKASSNNSDATLKNVIKFNLALLGRSTAAFSWEHPFGKIVSVEASLGVCFAQDYLQKTFSEVADAFNLNQGSKYVSLTNLLSNSTYSGPSPFLAAGLKLYFSDDAPEGSYVHINMRYSTNNLTYAPNIDYNSGIVSGSSDLTLKNLGFNFMYGYQLVSGNKKVSFIQDFYAGFGLRRTGYTGFQSTQQTNPNTGNYQTIYIADGTTQAVISPVFLIGYCLGFGF